MERDQAWERVFANLPVLERLSKDGLFRISANELKTHGGREPRLMAKIDTLAERPAIFAKHNLAIFPVKNGHYVLFPDPQQLSFYRFSDLNPTPIRNFRSTVDLNIYDTLPRGKESSESQALDFAFISGLLAHFCGETSMQLTLRGRFFSGKFSFRDPTQKIAIDVDRVQIEIDAGFEGQNGIYLLEAKRGRRDDFHIRQLWYPWLHWIGRTRKRVVPIFFTYSNGQYFLKEMEFGACFGEVRVVRSRAYFLDESPLAELDFQRLLETVQVEAEPAGSFPQANDLDKLVDLVLLEEPVSWTEPWSMARTKYEIAELFNFDSRQGDYYGNAACYLGLMQREGMGFALTQEGRDFASIKARAGRTEKIVAYLLRIPTFRAALELLVKQGFRVEKIANGELVDLIRARTPLNASTPLRRASTIRAWLTWIVNNIKVRPC